MIVAMIPARMCQWPVSAICSSRSGQSRIAFSRIAMKTPMAVTTKFMKIICHNMPNLSGSCSSADSFLPKRARSMPSCARRSRTILRHP